MDGTEIGWLETLFKWSVGVIGTGLVAWNGWIMTSISSLNRQMARHELEDARTYVSRPDFKDTVLEMKETIKRIYDKMDQISDTLSNLNRKQ